MDEGSQSLLPKHVSGNSGGNLVYRGGRPPLPTETYGGQPMLVGPNGPGVDDGSQFVTKAAHNLTRMCVILVIVLLVLVIVVASIGFFLGIKNFFFWTGEESCTNRFYGAITEISLGPVFGPSASCTATFIAQDGIFVTATHCLQDGDVCNFDGTNIPLVSGPRWVQVHNVNGTGEKWILGVEMIGWSGLSDVTVMRTKTLTLERGGTVSLTTQPFLTWGNSRWLQRGSDELVSMSYSANAVPKLGHRGAVQHPSEECADDGFLCTGVERVHFDTTVAPGASGSGVVDRNGNLVIAPLSFGHTFDGDGFSTSGTSQRVAQPLTERFITGVPNGPGKQFLVPTLGANSFGAVGLHNILDNLAGGPLNFAFTEIRGQIFNLLTDQILYDVLKALSPCLCGPMLPAHVVTPSSLLGAPLDVTEDGTPPATIPEIPTPLGNQFRILVAIEINLDSGNFQDLGDLPGLETVSGLIIGSGKWVGDVIRVRIRRFDATNPANPLLNWQALYRVTLQAVDPYLDALVPFFSLISPNFLLDSPTTPENIYYKPGTVVTKPIMDDNGILKHVKEIPEGMDTSGFVSVKQYFLNAVATESRKREEVEKKKKK